MDADRNASARKNSKTLAVIGGTVTFVSTSVYLFVCVWIAKGCPPMMPWVWHSVMRFCQVVALTFGAWGMMAERAYTTAMNESRLS